MKKMSVEKKEYEVLKLLGHGKGGYSYLVSDGKQEYVLKQIHHEPCSYYQFGNKMQAECNDYKRLKNAGIRIPQMYASDLENERILKEYIEGPLISELVMQERMKDSYLLKVRQMSRQAEAAGINIDYFPTNFVVCKEELYYIDYECNDYMQEWDFEHWGKQYWSKTPQFLQKFAL